jgi:hypothetical protein
VPLYGSLLPLATLSRRRRLAKKACALVTRNSIVIGHPHIFSSSSCHCKHQRELNHASVSRLRPHPSSTSESPSDLALVISCQKTHHDKHRLSAWSRCGVERHVMKSVIHTHLAVHAASHEEEGDGSVQARPHSPVQPDEVVRCSPPPDDSAGERYKKCNAAGGGARGALLYTNGAACQARL